MMSAAMSIVVLEIAIVLLAIVCVLVFLGWKQRKKLTQQIEQLMDAVNSQQDDRKKKLIQLLVEDYALDVAEAAEAGGSMVEAEKQFLQQFVKQQVEKTTVTDFYSQLCALLDQYLYFVPKNVQKNNIEERGAIKVTTDIGSLGDISEPEQAGEEEVKERDEPPVNAKADESVEEPEPDWGEAFAESGEEMDEEVKQGYESANVEADKPEEDPEPDWGEAFAESGEEMDEEVKQGYEEDIKK